MDFTFPKREKLKSKTLFDKLFAEGKSVYSYPIKLIYLRTEHPITQTGVAVSKRNFRSAVKRNRVKRLLREAYRLNKHRVFNNSEGSFAFLFLYIGKEMPSYLEVEKAMRLVFKKFLEAEEFKKGRNDKGN